MGDTQKSACVLRVKQRHDYVYLQELVSGAAFMTWLIIITGRPAAGKTTLAKWLGRQLSIPVFSKDDIKERLFDELGWRDREWSKMLGRASVELLYYLAETQLELGKSVILDNAFYPELASQKLQTIQKQSKANVLQVICNADANTLFERFKQRAESGLRHQGHVDKQSLAEYQSNLQKERPLQLDLDGRVIQIDTTDFASLRHKELLLEVKALIAQK